VTRRRGGKRTRVVENETSPSPRRWCGGESSTRRKDVALHPLTYDKGMVPSHDFGCIDTVREAHRMCGP
jgi:hypothetical protein